MGGKVCKLVCQRLAESGDALDKCQKKLAVAAKPRQIGTIVPSAEPEAAPASQREEAEPTAALVDHEAVLLQEEERAEPEIAAEGEKDANELAKPVNAKPASGFRSDLAPVLSKRQTSSKPTVNPPPVHHERTWRRSTTSPAIVYTKAVPLEASRPNAAKVMVHQVASGVQMQHPRPPAARVVPGAAQVVTSHTLPHSKTVQMQPRVHA
mmetsp:Transcript_8143/g.19180  ORF Transcript_8143/g.19180 Transcript_8143/m.19180 type:complete len:209 (-) Transcript_8143:190-816(-)